MSRGKLLQRGGHLDRLLERIFYCPSCTTIRLTRNVRTPHTTGRTPGRRNASTLSSSTAINATKPVPSQLRKLYEALLDVRRHAPIHINTSRLQLAIQGLESREPTIRLAILGLNVPDTARRIARLLLADALEDEGKWEQQLINGKDDYSRGLIIRYGQSENTNIPRPRNSIPVLQVPAETLVRNNLEILVSSIHGPDGHEDIQAVNVPGDSLLAPVVATPTSFEGRQTVISQPVHKTILMAQGFDELLAASRLLAFTRFDSFEDKRSVQIAVNFEDVDISKVKGRTFVLAAQSAEQGLAAIRTSVKQATEYEHKWMASGMPALSQWLKDSTGRSSSDSDVLREPVRSLIIAVIEAAEQNVENARQLSLETAEQRSLSSSERYSLEEAIEDFSRRAHLELQSGLASAWSSRNWRKLAWYKLFWRVDDVGLIVTDLVNNAWLPRTERAVYELSGRFVQVGINPVVDNTDLEMSEKFLESNVTVESGSQLEVQSGIQSAPEMATAAVAYEGMAIPSSSSSSTPQTVQTQPATGIVNSLLSRAGLRGNSTKQQQQQQQRHQLPEPQNLTTIISKSRREYIQINTTNLTTTSQQLVLRTISITGLSTGLSVLSYISTLTPSIYEASTIAALGTIFSLYKLQTGWQQETKRFESNLFRRGREIILDLNEGMKGLIEDKSVVDVDVAEKKALDKASEVISHARTELYLVDGDDPSSNSSGTSMTTKKI